MTLLALRLGGAPGDEGKRSSLNEKRRGGRDENDRSHPRGAVVAFEGGVAGEQERDDPL
jgi:hypothetical protein